jgi:hypothetical protein
VGSPGSSSRRFEEILWLDDERFAAIVSGPSAASHDYLLVFRRGRMVRDPTFQYADLAGLRPSPSGRLVAAYEPGRRIHVVNRRGEPVDLVMNRGRGISWSPDEEWIAEVTEGGIWVFRADGTGSAPIRIPIPAEDVLWSEP